MVFNGSSSTISIVLDLGQILSSSFPRIAPGSAIGVHIDSGQGVAHPAANCNVQQGALGVVLAQSKCNLG